jgi:hypothetical protein
MFLNILRSPQNTHNGNMTAEIGASGIAAAMLSFSALWAGKPELLDRQQLFACLIK